MSHATKALEGLRLNYVPHRTLKLTIVECDYIMKRISNSLLFTRHLFLLCSATLQFHMFDIDGL